MHKFWDEYHIPTTLDDALALLARYAGRARVVAGGTDLFLDLQGDYWEGHRPHYAALVDVTRIAGMNEIREEDGFIVIGCGVTHAQVVASPLIQARATALAEACAVIGGPQVRNVATLIGNVAHALPAADGAMALMVLGAEAQIANSKFKTCGERSRTIQNSKSEIQDAVLSLSKDLKSEIEWRPLASLYLSPGQSAVDPTREIIAAVRFRPTGVGEGSAFARVMRPQGIALPILGMAVKVKIQNSKSAIEDVAVSAGPVAPVPFRATRTEEFLRGKVLDDTALTQAAQILLSEVQPRTSAHRATREYRLELLPTLLREVLTRAVERAKA